MPVARRPYGGVSAEDRVSARRARLLDATLTIIGRDGVAAVTVDRRRTAQFEHTLVVTADGCDVLTRL